MQFSRAEVRSEHVWLERLSLPCVLETALEALSSLPADQLLAAAEAAQLPAALSCLPAAARASPVLCLLRRLSGLESEPALRLATEIWEVYDEGEMEINGAGGGCCARNRRILDELVCFYLLDMR